MICLLPNCCFLSETSRMLEIYRALRERGGSPAGIKVVTHGGPYESLLRAAGVPYDVLGPGVSTRRYQEFLRSVLRGRLTGRRRWC